MPSDRIRIQDISFLWFCRILSFYPQKGLLQFSIIFKNNLCYWCYVRINPHLLQYVMYVRIAYFYIHESMHILHHLSIRYLVPGSFPRYPMYFDFTFSLTLSTSYNLQYTLPFFLFSFLATTVIKRHNNTHLGNTNINFLVPFDVNGKIIQKIINHLTIYNWHRLHGGVVFISSVE